MCACWVRKENERGHEDVGAPGAGVKVPVLEDGLRNEC